MRIVLPVLFVALLIPRIGFAANPPSEGLYQIVSGTYTACCTLVGELQTGLPAGEQSYVRLKINATNGTASLTFLGQDVQTVSSAALCPSGELNFDLDYGFTMNSQVVFHADPGPPPYQLYHSYIVSNAGPYLRIDGQIGQAGLTCFDAPTRFGHSSVVAVRVPGPTLTSQTFSPKEGVRLMLQGHPGHTNIIEASSDLVNWVPVSTNVMDYSTCPVCPYAIFNDPASTNQPLRIYRVFEIW